MTFTLNAIIIAGCLLLFIAINLHNLLRHHAGFSTTTERPPETVKPMAFPLLLAGVGTGAFFLESFLYVLLAFPNNLPPVLSTLGFGKNQMALLEPLGLLVMVLGYAIFIWSVIARGRYATSWQMPANHKLVDWGPYRYVRHPSYSGYFLLFIGFLLLWHNLLAIVPLIAIPGYALITHHEEEMLLTRFGDKYLTYRKNVGGFVPRMRMRTSGDSEDLRS